MSTLSLADSTTLIIGGGLPPSSKDTSSSTRSYERLFIQPMDLSEPTSDILGYTQVCSLKLDNLEDLATTKLNRGGTVSSSDSMSGSSTSSMSDSEQLLPAYIVRLWSRASGRYLCILPVGASVYARGVFGPMGQFLMIVHAEDVVQFRSTTHPEHHLAVKGNSIVGDGRGGSDGNFIITQDEDGYCTLESEVRPGLFLGVRDNGNIMPPTSVDPSSHSAHFIVQKEAMDLV